VGLAAAPATRIQRSYLDTFDWRLFDRSEVLVFERGARDSLVLQHRGHERSDLRVPIAERPAVASELPPSLRQRIGSVIAPRTLIEVGHENVERWPLRLLDDEGKTVARVDVERVTSATAPPIVRVELNAVRGYERVARRVRAVLDSQADLSPAEDPLVLAARAAGREPGVGPAPLPPTVPKGVGALEAIASVLEHQLDIVVALEEGVRQDLDPDLLHEFRIAVRRTRSVVRLSRRHLPDKVRYVWDSEWLWLAAVTGPPRDLDVLLMEVDHARATLPSDEKAGLDEIQEIVSARRRAAQEKLVLALNGDRYGTLKRGWRYELGELRTASGDAGASNAHELAVDLIERATKQLSRCVAAVDADSPAEVIHDVRKRGKQLRYALDLFGRLLPDKRVKTMRKATKDLQDHLGEFQDNEVHREWVSTLLEGADMLSPEAVATCRLLIARYDARLAAVRASLADRLHQFRVAPGRT
jgi:CHAD domain-containing protein